MTAPFQNQVFVGWTRFHHKDFQCTVVTDGPMNIGSPANGFPNADPREIIEFLANAFLPTDSVTLNQNLLIVNTGQNLVLFDIAHKLTPAGSHRVDAAGITTGVLFMSSELKSSDLDAEDLSREILACEKKVYETFLGRRPDAEAWQNLTLPDYLYINFRGVI